MVKFLNELMCQEIDWGGRVGVMRHIPLTKVGFYSSKVNAIVVDYITTIKARLLRISAVKGKYCGESSNR